MAVMTTAKFVALDDLDLAITDLESDYGWLTPGCSREERLGAKMDDVVAALRAVRAVLLADDE